jgi:ABC-2 type transport system permease protein
MSKVWLVCRRELGSFFSTWTGYVIVTAALIIEGLLFNAFALTAEPRFSEEVLYDFFYFGSGVAIIASIFLSLRLFAEERQSGTLVLFFTSPISERQMVYGKFLSVFFFLLMMHVVSLYMPALIFVHGKVSVGHMAAGYLCLILIGAATSAISLFASSIAPNQLVAGVLGACITVFLLILWIVANVVEPPLKDIFSNLALHNVHFSSFAKGIVHTRDIVYYASVAFFFLECSVRVLETRRWRG